MPSREEPPTLSPQPAVVPNACQTWPYCSSSSAEIGGPETPSAASRTNESLTDSLSKHLSSSALELRRALVVVAARQRRGMVVEAVLAAAQQRARRAALRDAALFGW